MEMDKNNKAFKVGDTYSDYDCEVEVIGRTAQRVKLNVVYRLNGKKLDKLPVQMVRKPQVGVMDIWGTNYPMEYINLGKNKTIYSIFVD